LLGHEDEEAMILGNVDYSRIDLVWQAQDWTGARLSNIPDYQTVLTLT
jgi:hypothetical protein